MFNLLIICCFSDEISALSGKNFGLPAWEILFAWAGSPVHAANFFIFRLRIHILSLKMYILSLRICILRLKI